MLQAEAEWHRRSEDVVNRAAEVMVSGTLRRSKSPQARAAASELHRVSPKPRHHRRWLLISPTQAMGLLEHHEESRSIHASSAGVSEAEKKAMSALNRTSVFANSDATARVEYTVQDDQLAPGDALLQGIRQHIRRKNSPVNGGMAVTGLTSLSSQYVGPIGVGTVVSPSNCEVKNGQALSFVQDGEEKEVGCHLQDESQVWVVFDTGSTNIWVASDLCRHGACVKKGRHRYDHTRSATYESPSSALELTVQFGTGCIKGPQAQDDFHIGPFTVFNQTFGMIETQSGKVFSEVPFEGILGLAFASMSANGVRPFFDSIIKQKALVKNEFAFYFSVDSVTANAVFWGGVDPAFFEGQIEYYPVTDPYYWAIDLLSFKVGEHEFAPDVVGSDEEGGEILLQSEGSSRNMDEIGGDEPQTHSWKAIVDTGTTFFTAEGRMYDDILAMLKTAKCTEMTAATHPPITYRLRSASGKVNDFILHNRQYMTSDTSDPDALCSPAFMRIDIPPQHGPAMVLGECFLRHYYSVFDRSDGSPSSARVGFAKAKHDQEPVDQLMRLTHGQQYFKIPDTSKDS